MDCLRQCDISGPMFLERGWQASRASAEELDVLTIVIQRRPDIRVLHRASRTMCRVPAAGRREIGRPRAFTSAGLQECQAGEPGLNIFGVMCGGRGMSPENANRCRHLDSNREPFPPFHSLTFP